MDLLDIINRPASTNGISRRKFIGMGLMTAVAALVPPELFAAAEPAIERSIRLYNVYTWENLETVYWKDGNYIPEALSKINHIFRDSRTGKERNISKELINLLYNLQKELKPDQPFHIISGYRTPQSNAVLRKTRKGVAKNSLHILGKAADIRLPGYSLKGIRRTAMELGKGGVGYYPQSQFVHVDVGHVRYWRG